MSMEATRPAFGPKGGHSERLEFRAIYAVSFLLFLPAVVARRCLPGKARRGGGRRQSILKETAAAANTVVPFAFMG